MLSLLSFTAQYKTRKALNNIVTYLPNTYVRPNNSSLHLHKTTHEVTA